MPEFRLFPPHILPKLSKDHKLPNNPNSLPKFQRCGWFLSSGNVRAVCVCLSGAGGQHCGATLRGASPEQAPAPRPQRKNHAGWLATCFPLDSFHWMDASSGFVLISLSHPEKMSTHQEKSVILPTEEGGCPQEGPLCPLSLAGSFQDQKLLCLHSGSLRDKTQICSCRENPPKCRRG